MNQPRFSFVARRLKTMRSAWPIGLWLLMQWASASAQTELPPSTPTAPNEPSIENSSRSMNKVPQTEEKHSGEKISLHFQNIEVRALLQVIADFTHFNVVTSDSVTGTLSLHLDQVPWEQALDVVMQAKGLGMRKNGNVLWIATKEELAIKEKQEHESRLALESLQAMQTHTFVLNYAKAVDVALLLGTGRSVASGNPNAGGNMSGNMGNSTGMGMGMGLNSAIAPTAYSSSTGGLPAGRMLSARGNVVADARTNQMLVTDLPSRIEQVRQIIAKLDIPIRQVMIEARIVQANDTFSQSLGVRLGGSGTLTAQHSAQVSVGGSYDAVSNMTGQSSLNSVGSQFVSLPAIAAAGYAAPAFAAAIFDSSASRFLNLEISAIEAQGKGQVVSSPRVVTADQVKAIIEQGTEIPYQVTASLGVSSLAFRKAQLKLEVTPQITPEGGIILSVDVTKDSVGQATPAGYSIDTKHVNTQVLVDNGGTVVIGGIFEVSQQDQVTKVPFLGDLPLIGALFRSTYKMHTKSELLVFLTPRTLSGAQVLAPS